MKKKARIPAHHRFSIKTLLSNEQCTRLLVGRLGHTDLVHFVDKLGKVCWEVHLEYVFEVLGYFVHPGKP